ncbi:hypothetical protein BDN72DRAFT_864939 [Pluteus cervinus]|uniref:Uncharacterized protein n=1 Tax=Pluteus cervinus TaxID=181527 RepID=A0ACD3A203_9AGAR|nr:hypothetical protein BDN72DRAFT_864939 [Pluteus cervinus]
MPATWTSAEQKEFLQTKVQGFIEARGIGRGTRYAKSVHAEFSQRWSERDHLFPAEDGKPPRALTKAEEKSLDTLQILTWLQRNAAPRSRLATKAARRLLNRHRPKRKRIYQAGEIYTKLYSEKVNAVYQERKVEGLSNGARLNLIRKIAEELLDGETDEVKAKIAQKQLEQRDQLSATADAQSDDDVELDDVSRDKLILELPELLGSVLGEAHKLCPSWGFLVLAAGPRQKAGNRTNVFDIYVGPKTLTTKYGFPEAYAKFDINFRQPFGQFLRDCNDEFKYTEIIESEDELDSPPRPPPRRVGGASTSSTTKRSAPPRVESEDESVPELQDIDSDSDTPPVAKRSKKKVTPRELVSGLFSDSDEDEDEDDVEEAAQWASQITGEGHRDSEKGKQREVAQEVHHSDKEGKGVDAPLDVNPEEAASNKNIEEPTLSKNNEVSPPLSPPITTTKTKALTSTEKAANRALATEKRLNTLNKNKAAKEASQKAAKEGKAKKAAAKKAVEAAANKAVTAKAKADVVDLSMQAPPKRPAPRRGQPTEAERPLTPPIPTSKPPSKVDGQLPPIQEEDLVGDAQDEPVKKSRRKRNTDHSEPEEQPPLKKTARRKNTSTKTKENIVLDVPASVEEVSRRGRSKRERQAPVQRDADVSYAKHARPFWIKFMSSTIQQSISKVPPSEVDSNNGEVCAIKAISQGIM